MCEETPELLRLLLEKCPNKSTAMQLWKQLCRYNIDSLTALRGVDLNFLTGKHLFGKRRIQLLREIQRDGQLPLAERIDSFKNWLICEIRDVPPISPNGLVLQRGEVLREVLRTLEEEMGK